MRSVTPTNRSLQSAAGQQGASLSSAEPSSSRVSKPQGDGGVRGGWPDSRLPQPAASESQRLFSHSRPEYSGGQLQRALLTHTPPFWQRRSSSSHTGAAAGEVGREETQIIGSL